MKRTQEGLTLIGFIVVLAVVGVFAYVGMKVAPMYSEFYSVKQAMKAISAEPGIGNMAPRDVMIRLFNRLNISYASSIKQENIKLKRGDRGWVMTIDYEVRRPLIANLDVVGKFHAEEVLARGGPD
jgi:hypothetical protein